MPPKKQRILRGLQDLYMGRWTTFQQNMVLRSGYELGTARSEDVAEALDKNLNWELDDQSVLDENGEAVGPRGLKPIDDEVRREWDEGDWLDQSGRLRETKRDLPYVELDESSESEVDSEDVLDDEDLEKQLDEVLAVENDPGEVPGSGGLGEAAIRARVNSVADSLSSAPRVQVVLKAAKCPAPKGYKPTPKPVQTTKAPGEEGPEVHTRVNLNMAKAVAFVAKLTDYDTDVFRRQCLIQGVAVSTWDLYRS